MLPRVECLPPPDLHRTCAVCGRRTLWAVMIRRQWLCTICADAQMPDKSPVRVEREDDDETTD
jgi:hypothetical protein